MRRANRYVSNNQIWLYAVLKAWGACDNALIVLDRDIWHEGVMRDLVDFLNNLAEKTVIPEWRYQWWINAVNSTDEQIVTHLLHDIEAAVSTVSWEMHQRDMANSYKGGHGRICWDFARLRYQDGDNEDLPF